MKTRVVRVSDELAAEVRLWSHLLGKTQGQLLQEAWAEWLKQHSNTGVLLCPDCSSEFPGRAAVTCANGHRELRLEFFPICKCGHDVHYDMTTFCLEGDCTCEQWDPGDRFRQITMRPL